MDWDQVHAAGVRGAHWRPRGGRVRRPALGHWGAAVASWVLGIAGLAAYNWWLLVPLRPGLMHSPDELFSNLEVTGQPYAAAMQHADLLSGLLLAAAFLAAGSGSIPGGRPEWRAMMVFTAATAAGGVFPEVCADEVSPRCWSLEWHFQLPLSQYLHMAAGIAEFGAITVALLFAFVRTRGQPSATARAYRALAAGAVAAYPLLGLAYLLGRLGGVMEMAFFTGFTLMVATQLRERTAAALGATPRDRAVSRRARRGGG
jgi:Protein of unknown function (DUF998)